MSDLQLVPIRRLVDDVVVHGKRHWRQILPSVFLVQLSVGLLALTLQGRQLELMASPNPSPEELLSFFGLFFPLFFVIMSIFLVAFTAVMVAAMDGLDGRAIDMKRAWGFALVPKVYLTNGVVLVLVTISFMCCILPVLYVGPLLAFVLPVMMHQGVYGMEAMRRSQALAKYNPTGRWQDSSHLHILGVLLAGMLVNYALSFVAQLPMLVMQVMMTVRQASAGQLAEPVVPPLWMQVPTQVLVALVTTLSWIYWCFAIAALYREILRRRDGGDLAHAIDRMTGGPGAGTPPGPSAGAPPSSPPYPAPSDQAPPPPRFPGDDPRSGQG